MNIISGYRVILFEDRFQDAACISRIIELYCLNKLRDLSDKLKEVTGLSLPDMEITEEEMNILLNRCVSLCRREEEETAFRQGEVTDAEYRLNASRNASRTLSEAQRRRSNEYRDAEHRYTSALSRLAEQKERMDCFRTLPGLLRDVVGTTGLSINTSLFNQYPQTLRIPDCFSRRDYGLTEPLFLAGVTTTETLQVLEQAAREIVEKCQLPRDKYDIANGGALRSKTYRHYYRPDNCILQAIISATDYVNYVTENAKYHESRTRFFK